MPLPAASPTLRRRELGRRLRELRLAQGLTVEQVAAHLLCSPSKVSRMETGQRGATRRDVRDLCDLYGVTQAASREHMMELATEGKQPGWWTSYDLNRFAVYVGLETAAVGLAYYKALTMPGLLQTEDYARAMNRTVIPGLTPEQIEENVEVKLKRQQRLTGVPILSVRAVIDEAVLRRVVGGPRVMAGQLGRLVELVRSPEADVTIQVIPFGVGAHAAMESTFNLLEFPNPEPSVVYVEGLAGWIYFDRPEDISRYKRIFDHLQAIALSPAESIALVARLGEEYKRMKWAEVPQER